LYFFFNKSQKINNEIPLTSKDSKEEIYNSNIINDVNYKSKDPDGNEYIINALKGEIDYSNPNVLYLTKVRAKIKLKNSKLPKNLKEEMKESFRDISKKWPKGIPSSVIHGDLFIDNIFFHKGKFGGFIDFYFSAYDFQAYELAICINSLCFNKTKNKFKFNKKKASKLFKGYESIRKLKPEEKRSMKILCKGSALRYLATRAYDYVNTPKNILIKKKDPSEYIQKLRFHDSIEKFEEYLND